MNRAVISINKGRVAIALVAMTVMVYEIAVTRLLSVVFWYHFAFLSISVAMVGLGVPGVWLSLRPASARLLSRSLLAAGVSIPLSVIVIVKARPIIFEAGLGSAGWVAMVIAAMLLPMCSLGAAICLLLVSAEGKSVGKMYAADLFGATAGAIAVIPFLSWVATPTLGYLLNTYFRRLLLGSAI
jgi:hypothetical protein